MSKDQIVVALDIGSSKMSCAVATIDRGRVSVIGAYTHPSQGIKDGVVNNIDKAVSAISETLNKAEMMSGHAISRVAVTVSGTHIESLNSHGVVAVSGEDSEISAEDLMRVNEAAQAISLPSSRLIIDVIPREYIVDKQRGILDPTGMTGVRLEVEANIIHGSMTAIKNLTKCVQQVGVEVDDLIYTGLASGEAVLTDTEKELGVMLIDIGSDTMDIIIYTGGRPVYAAVIPVGGQDITNDIAIGLRTLLEDAEYIKIKLATEEALADKNIYIDKEGRESKIARGELYVGDLNIGVDTVSKSALNDIIFRRIEESFKFAHIYMKKAGFDKKLPAGVVITGGTAQIRGIEKIAENVFKLSSRVGYPIGLTGITDHIQTPAHAATVGMLKMLSQAYSENGKTSSSKRGSIKSGRGLPHKVISLLKSFLP